MFVDAIDPIEMLCLWPQAMRRIAKLPPPDPEMQEWFAGLWHRSGDHLRQETLDDRILVRALRVMLPPWTGGPRTLYRGDTAWARRYRTYGLSWSGSQRAAECFAEDTPKRTVQGGTIVLRAEAPAAAILSGPPIDDRYGEEEYIVDPRMLAGITVLARYPQLTHEQYDEHQRDLQREIARQRVG
jgi:hypothetical protein